MADAGAAPGTIRNCFENVLKPLLDLGVELGYARANPATGVKLPRSDRAEMLFLTAEEVADLADEIGGDHRLAILFSSYVGCRAGELGALRLKHLDLMRGRVTIAESVTAVKGKGLVYGPTKTYAVRTITLPKFLIDRLAAYVAPRAKNPDAFVFVTETGMPLRHGNFYNDHFRPAVARLVARGTFRPELAGLRAHDLRHTAVALAIAVNPNPKIVMTRMGHSSIAVTYDRYGHLFPGADEDLAVALDAVYKGTRGGSAGVAGGGNVENRSSG